MILLLPFGLQAVVMAVDELVFHRRRGLDRREWLGHAADSAGLLACLALPLALRPTPAHLGLYAALAAGSCLLVTKDEFIHQRLCSGGEHWCHAVLFLLHPVVLMATAGLWLGLLAPSAAAALWMLRVQALAVAAFMAFQLAWWARR